MADADGDVMVFGLSSDPEVAMRKLNGAFQPLREMSMDNIVYCSPIYANGVLYLTSTSKLWAIVADLAPADVVTLYLLPQQNEKLAPRLRKMKPGSRIVSHQFGIPGMTLEKTVIVESQESGEKHTVFLYVVPVP